MTINAYPLQWPDGWKRTMPAHRGHAKFGKASRYEGYGDNKRWIPSRDLTIAESRQRVLAELQRMGLKRDDVVISTNLPLRLDGEPRSDARNPEDPGVAVYWQDPFNSAPRVMAIDQYLRVADNLAAIAATLDAMRAIERHGGAMILERAFTGFTALPAPGATRTWREVLGFGPADQPSQDLVRERYRSRASQEHPDKGGTDAGMAELNRARDQALLECRQ